jgi:hypothetical protein
MNRQSTYATYQRREYPKGHIPFRFCGRKIGRSNSVQLIEAESGSLRGGGGVAGVVARQVDAAWRREDTFAWRFPLSRFILRNLALCPDVNLESLSCGRGYNARRWSLANL